MAPKAEEKRTDNQRKVFDFFVERFKSQEPFTKKEVEAVTSWQGKSFLTHWSKQFKQFVVPAGGKSFRMTEAATVEENGDRYLIDETTAIVRFIFPCGQPQKLPLGLAQDFDVPEPNTDDATGDAEADRIRWFFNALFVQSIVQVVNGEDEIWMVESGMRNRLHRWKVGTDTND